MWTKETNSVKWGVMGLINLCLGVRLNVTYSIGNRSTGRTNPEVKFLLNVILFFIHTTISCHFETILCATVLLTFTLFLG